MFGDSLGFYSIYMIVFALVAVLAIVLLARLILAATKALNAYTAWRRLSTELLIADNETPTAPSTEPAA